MTYALTWLSWKVGPDRFKRGRLLVAYHNISWNENFYQHRVHTCDWFQISTVNASCHVKRIQLHVASCFKNIEDAYLEDLSS